jgi:hypothetical protein
LTAVIQTQNKTLSKVEGDPFALTKEEEDYWKERTEDDEYLVKDDEDE